MRFRLLATCSTRSHVLRKPPPTRARYICHRAKPEMAHYVFALRFAQLFSEDSSLLLAFARAAQSLEDFLLKRLKKDNVHVKLKVLRVMKHCCLQGHATFRRDMQRHTTEIKECLSYRGTADPLHGDALNNGLALKPPMGWCR